jgi:VanZ family protein
MKQTDHIQKIKGTRSWLRFFPVIAWMAVIFIMSSRTGDDLGSILPWFQQFFPGMADFNWGHLIAYFILALLADFAIGRKADRWRFKLAIVLFCLLYGVSDEYHQSFVSGRTSDVMDLRNDTIGAALAVLVVKIPFVREKWRRIAGQ